MIAAALADNEADELVMRAAYELVALLGLRDCRWVVGEGELPVARLDDDGSVHFGVHDWRADRLGLPLRGVHRPLVSHGVSYGALVLVPRTYERVPIERLRGAVTVSDVVALGLHDRRATVVPGAGS